ncbi:hypothetical protein L249_7399, partial [Ophiocordyceps polyrhachis-furcata BCC 54312]
PKARHNALSHSGAIAPSHRSARCTNSGHSARSVVTAVITVIVTAIDALQIVRLIHDVKVFLQITYLPSMTYSHVILQLHHFFNTITSPAFNSSSILTKPPSRNSSSSSLSRDPHLDYSSSFPLPQITF